MDLANFDVESRKVAPMTLKHPVTGRPVVDETTDKPVTITLLSADSTEARAKQLELSGKNVNEVVGRRRGKLDVGQIDVDAVKMLAFLTKSWEGIVVDKEALQCTPQNAEKLYTRFPFMREQVETFVNDRSNYLGN